LPNLESCPGAKVDFFSKALGVCFTRFCSIQFGTIPEIELAA
jgi:hypothetical protein